MTQDNSLLAALAISAVNNVEQTSAHLPRNAEKKNILSAVIIWRLNDHHIWKNRSLMRAYMYWCSVFGFEGYSTKNRDKLVFFLLKGWGIAAGNSDTTRRSRFSFTKSAPSHKGRTDMAVKVLINNFLSSRTPIQQLICNRGVANWCGLSWLQETVFAVVGKVEKIGFEKNWKWRLTIACPNAKRPCRRYKPP